MTQTAIFMRFKSMTMLGEDKIIKFKKRLFRKTLPGILKSGTKDISPIETCKKDEQGKIVVSTNDIISFFLAAVTKEGSLNTEQYVAGLYLLFDILTKESEAYSFQSGMQISEKDILEANNEITIEYLTKNLIISYFDNIKLSDGLANHDLLDKDLNTIIKKTNESRDYRTLVAKTLENLTQALKSTNPWRQDLAEIQKAATVCRLVGEQLPRIEKTILSKIVLESRTEIKKEIRLFAKLLLTRAQLSGQEKNQKLYLKMMDKFDLAITGTLNKIEACLGYVHQFMDVLGASSKGFLGQADSELKKNIAGFFFEFHEQPSESIAVSHSLRYSVARHRAAMLFKYPELTRFAGLLQHEEKYRACFLFLFKVYFDQLVKEMEHIISASGPNDFKKMELSLFSIVRLNNKLGLNKSMLLHEKKKVYRTYLSLVKNISLEQLSFVIDMKETVCQAVQDDAKELFEDIRTVLVDSCYAALFGLEVDALSEEACHQTILKLITGYSLFYKPRRFFYQRFFEKYVGKKDGSVSDFLNELFNTRKRIALKLLEIFSDPNHVGDLIFREQIAFSENLHKFFLKQNGNNR